IPLTRLSLERHGKQSAVGSAVAWSIQPLPTIVKDAQRRLIFPIHQLPSDQRMLVLGVTDEFRVLPAIVVLPAREFFAALALFHGTHESCCRFLRGMIA